ncbi:MAG: 50S ribosomal protein L13 [Candidatus Bathyarchaeia archaeon]
MGGEGFTVIDADGLVLGRMASIVAKRLLNGERIIVVNAEDAIISGNRKNIIKERKEFLEVGGARRGPIHWRRPDRFVRRTIRGMLPYRKPRGKEAFKRLRVYIGVPRGLEGRERETLEDAHVSRLRGKFVTVGAVAESIGWNP